MPVAFSDPRQSAAPQPVPFTTTATVPLKTSATSRVLRSGTGYMSPSELTQARSAGEVQSKEQAQAFVNQPIPTAAPTSTTVRRSTANPYDKTVAEQSEAFKRSQDALAKFSRAGFAPPTQAAYDAFKRNPDDVTDPYARKFMQHMQNTEIANAALQNAKKKQASWVGDLEGGGAEHRKALLQRAQDIRTALRNPQLANLDNTQMMALQEQLKTIDASISANEDPSTYRVVGPGRGQVYNPVRQAQLAVEKAEADKAKADAQAAKAATSPGSSQRDLTVTDRSGKPVNVGKYVNPEQMGTGYTGGKNRFLESQTSPNDVLNAIGDHVTDPYGTVAAYLEKFTGLQTKATNKAMAKQGVFRMLNTMRNNPNMSSKDLQAAEQYLRQSQQYLTPEDYQIAMQHLNNLKTNYVPQSPKVAFAQK